MTTKVSAGAQAPALTDDEALLEAMRNLWPILSKTGREQAIEAANNIG